MGQIDWILSMNWIISGFIGLLFGIIGGWATYRFDRKRDDIAWEREKQRIQDEWQHQRELLEVQFNQKLAELETQLRREENERLRSTLLRGVDNPAEAIDRAMRARTLLQLDYLKMRAETLIPESKGTDYLLSLHQLELEHLTHDQLSRIMYELESANLALAVLKELQAKLEWEDTKEREELGANLLGNVEKNKIIEDMRHHLVWDHHDSGDAKGSTWSAIAAEAGRFNYDYRFLVFFLKLKNQNNGWQIPGTSYAPVPIPSLPDFLEILDMRSDQIKRVLDTKDLSLKWNWPVSWGHVSWNGPIVHTDTTVKLDNQYYLETARKEYVQTRIAIEQYRLLDG